VSSYKRETGIRKLACNLVAPRCGRAVERLQAEEVWKSLDEVRSGVAAGERDVKVGGASVFVLLVLVLLIVLIVPVPVLRDNFGYAVIIPGRPIEPIDRA